MSDADENKESYGDTDSAIYAIAPKLSQEEGQVDVSSSPAFQCLDDLFRQRKLDGEKLARLKSMYTAHHDLLQGTRESESALLSKAKDLHQEVEKQRAELEKADNFPEGEVTEVSRLRQDLLKHSNELAQADERQYQLDFILAGLKEERTMLEREYSRMPKEEEIEKEMKDLKKFIEEMKVEVARRNQETKTLKEEMETRDREVKQLQSEFEKSSYEEQNLKSQLLEVHSQPAHLLKQVDLMSRQLKDLDEKQKSFESNIADVNKELQLLENRKQFLDDEKMELAIALDRQRHTNESKEREVDMFLKDLEFSKEKQAELIGDRATLDINVKHNLLERKTEHDIHCRNLREKDRNLKDLKKAELQVKVANDALEQVKLVHAKVKSQLDIAPKDDGTLFQKRKELQKEVDLAKKTLAQQNGYTSHERARVEQMILEQENLLRDQSNLRLDVVDLKRLAAIKADERESKARDFVRAELRYQRAQEDVKTKNLHIQDSAKKYSEMQYKLTDFAKLYDVIKNERNKCVNLIQTSTQRASEMREKIKILQNEIEILRSKVNSKDRSLQKSHLKKNNAIAIRDSLRNEVSKHAQIGDENKEKREQKRMDIAKLNDLINKAEENMVQLRKRYEQTIQQRNDRGIKLIERNEEVCVFYEKLNVQEALLRNGDMELRAREEEIRILELEVAELKRLIAVAKKTLPKKKSLDDELVTTQIQLILCQDHLLDLEKQLETPSEDGRIRVLKGDDPKPDELTAKVEELELRLAEKEEKLLEKALIFEEVNRLTERTKKKAETGKEDTLNLAKKVNEFQAKIKATTRKMMAMVSELSMNQANAMKLQQEVKEKEVLLEQCYIRMERGEAPDEEAEKTWMKMIRDEQRNKQEKIRRTEVEALQEQYKIAGDVYTTAEPRPNAYIPDDDAELPIPRPYGALAPFKPSEPGSSMRHVRKPVIKPIEI